MKRGRWFFGVCVPSSPITEMFEISSVSVYWMHAFCTYLSECEENTGSGAGV